MFKIITMKQVVAIVGLGLLVGATSAQAATIGNPTATVPVGSFRVGVDTEFNERDYVDDDDDTGSIETKRYQLKAAFGITDNIEIFGKAGMGELTVEDFDEFDDGLVYGGGIKATVYSANNLKLGLTAQISGQNNEYSYDESGTYYGYAYTYNETLEVDITEIEIAAGASYQIGDIFVPYAGVMYSDAEAEADLEEKMEISGYGSVTATGSDTVEGEDSVGAFVGADINFSKNFNIGVEGRFVHETSFSALANFTF